MKLVGLIVKSARRSKRRTALTVLSVAIAVFLFASLRAILDGFNAAAAARPGIFAASALGFDTRSERRIGSGGLEFIATPNLTLRADVSSTRREGVRPSRDARRATGP